MSARAKRNNEQHASHAREKKAKLSREEDESESDASGDERREELLRKHGLCDEDGRGAERFEKNRATSGPQAGIIKQILVENFMCHKKLEVNFGPSINFINGQNGSGKSAILAAIQICLGAKASVTHRAKGLKDLIRVGSNADAYVKVTVHNTPTDGWKFEEYGHSIIVERRIPQSGSASFKLMGESGRTLSTDKRQLIEMLDYLNIQVENPCAVLDQENSKKFLQGNSKDKYKFFMKSTNLDSLIEKIEETHNIRATIEEEAKKLQLKLKPLLEIVNKAKQELEEFKNFDMMENNIARSKAALAWACVETKEQDAEQKISMFKKLLRKVNEEQTKLEGTKKECDAEEEKLSALKIRSTELNEQCNRAMEGIHTIKGHLQQQEKPLLEMLAKEKEMKMEAKEIERLKHSAERHITEAREKAAASEAMKAAEKAKMEEIRITQQNLQDIAAEDNGINESFQVTESEFQQSKAGFNEARQDTKEIANKVGREEDLIRRLQQSANNPINKFGPAMGEIVEEIRKRSKQFTTPPIGPIGAFISIDPRFQEYSVAAEACIERIMDNFVVSTPRDKSELQKIFTAKIPNRRQPAIIMQSAFNGRYRIHQLPAEIITVAKALNVDNDLAFNVLVDQCKIDAAAIFPTKEAGERALLMGSPGCYKLNYGIKEVYITGREKADMFYERAGNTTYRTNVGPYNRVLGLDVREQILHRQRDLDILKQEVSELAAIEKEKEEDMHSKEVRLLSIQKQRSVIGENKRKLAAQARKLGAELDELRAATEAVDTSAWEAEVEEYTIGLREMQLQLSQLDRDIKQSKTDMEPLKQQLSLEKEKSKDLNKEMEEVEKEYTLLVDRTATFREKRAKAVARIQELEENVQSAKIRVAEVDKELEACIDEAKEICHALINDWDGMRIDTKGKTEKEIEAYIEKRVHKLEEAKRKKNLNRKSKEECERHYFSALSSYKEKQDLIQKILQNAERLEDENQLRKDKYKTFRKYIQRQTTSAFDAVLNEKGSSGEVKFCSREGTLDITVQKDNMNESTQTNDIKALSGGERSYATLALLLSLGASIECPFRIMDEFDIFMDAVSRKTALTQVIQHGRAPAMKQRQIILITPQNLDSVELANDIKILKLEPPKRSSEV